jgi:Cytochrome P450
MQNMFSTSSTSQHAAMKRAVASKYSISSLQSLEPQVDSCTELFISIMHEYADLDKVVDLGEWLQWYAFDVIGAITFNKKFGFMDKRKDIKSIIEGIENGLIYMSVIGQVPELHPWLMGNQTLMRWLSNIPAVREGDPLRKIVQVSSFDLLTC